MATGFPALMIRPPEAPLQQYAQAQQVMAGQQEQQMRALQIQQEQQRISDQHALTTAMTQWDGKDYKSLPMQVLKAGGSGNAAMTMTQNVLAMKEKASTIAKDDSITAQNTSETHIKQMDEVRGRILNITDGITDPAEKQTAWEKEIAKEQAAGTDLPPGITSQYPGDAPAKAIANSLALGSTLQKEAQEKQKLALDAWKTSGGQLVNVITGEKIGGVPNVEPLNKAMEARWQVLHPGESLPDYFSLKVGATPAEFERVDKLMEATEKASATKAQQGIINTMRQQTFEMQREKTDMQAVVGTDPKSGRQVMLPVGQAQQMGVANPMKADADMVNKALAARHWLNLANKQADPKAPGDEMGIMQLVDKLDSEGKLGPLASRWNEFMTGKVGAGDPDVAALRAKMGLSSTLLMQAHVGSRGSAQMLEHFEDLANQKKLDGPTLKAALGAEVNYVEDKAMDPNPPDYSKGRGGKAAALAAIPANVSKALAGQSTGRHTLSDGSVWDKHADGTVVKAE